MQSGWLHRQAGVCQTRRLHMPHQHTLCGMPINEAELSRVWLGGGTMISESDLTTARGLLFDYLATHRREDHTKLRARVREFVSDPVHEKVILRVHPMYGEEKYITNLIVLYGQTFEDAGHIEHWFDNEKRDYVVKVPKQSEAWWRAWVT